MAPPLNGHSKEDLCKVLNVLQYFKSLQFSHLPLTPHKGIISALIFSWDFSGISPKFILE